MKVQIAFLVACWLHLVASQCPPGVPVVTCFADPCTTTSCPNNPTATCRANYCGGCNAYYYDSNGNNVTESCTGCRGLGGRYYQAGESYTAEDGCNTCTCTSSGLGACTRRACPPLPPTTPAPVSCRGPNGTMFSAGQTYTAADGCNTCTCTDSGHAICTLRLCPPIAATTPPPPPDVCALTGPVAGRCFGYFPRYFYNATSRTCQRFIYGGCGGNGNNFETEQACRERCVVQPPVNVTVPPPTAVCNTSDGRTYRAGETYTASDGCNTCTCFRNGLSACTLIACPPVNTTGCVDEAGVHHRIGESFNLRNNPCSPCICTTGGRVACAIVDCPPPSYRCQDGSQPVRQEGFCCPVCPNVTVITTTAAPTDVCAQTGPVPGHCRGSFPRYFYNATSRTCQRFIYGGCGGNENNFETEQACRERCAVQPPVNVTFTPPHAVCNTSNGRTYRAGETFTAPDGCNTCTCTSTGVAACTEMACLDVCVQTGAVTGRCRAYIPRYFYNVTSQTCQRFIYGGCGGNGNNFETEQACLQRCSVCYKPIYPPNYRPVCNVAYRRWTYNTERRQCEEFTYFPCLSPEDGYNVFDTEQECINRCGPAPTCANNMVYETCGTACPLTCDNYRNGPIPCTDQCVQGCFCPQGMVLNNGRCVAPSDCPVTPTCTNGKVYESCGTACPLTCDNVHNPPSICPAVCRQGCFCPQGLVEYNGGCVEPSECPAPTCTNGKVYETCGTACPLTCDNYQNAASIPCTLQCVQGCFCPHGMVDNNGQCVAPSDCPAAAQCTDHNGRTFAAGQSFPSADGCNSCYCTSTGNAICTERACAPATCSLKDVTIDHTNTYDDECSTCQCQFGRLNCQRKDCPVKTNTKPTKVNMTFDGDLDRVAPTDDHKENLKREMVSTMLAHYKQTLGLSQDQLNSIEVKKGSVIFVITLTGTDFTAGGANLTILLSQLQQDYMSGSFVIRYNSQVLQPTGSMQVEEPEDEIGEFPWWGILMVSVGGLLFVVSVVVLVAVVVLVRKTNTVGQRRPKHLSAVNNTYVTYKAEEDDVDVKQLLS